MTRKQMTPTRYPGFSNITFDAQQTFRGLLHALSHPGSVTKLGVQLGHPGELHPACAAACLTLLDIDTQVWVQPDFSSEVTDWLVFHTGCRFVDRSREADFALVKQGQLLPSLTQFNWGTPEIPERSTTVLVQTNGFGANRSVDIQGPGIQTQQDIALGELPACFWSEWQENSLSYPLGIDMLWFCDRHVIGLPRTSRLATLPQDSATPQANASRENTEVTPCLT
ncbi:MAG: phosphonate C-P lyase system protein PhnH [Cyanobacteria bacterium P01_E01_bin.34]